MAPGFPAGDLETALSAHNFRYRNRTLNRSCFTGILLSLLIKQPKASASGKKILMQLRLAVARATVRYALDTRGADLDIPSRWELSELCDEYALRALAIWLATTCGSHICRSAMSKTNPENDFSLLSHMVRTNEYPFANPISAQLEREIIGISQDHLSQGLAPQVELLGTLFELIANQSLDICLENGGQVGFDMQAKERRRIVGQFYTPPQVVKYCFDIALSGNLAGLIKSLKPAKSAVILTDETSYIEKTLKVLDPSAGTGNFLCGFIQYVREDLKKSEPALLYALACHSLYGRELDGRAACLSRLAITLCLAKEIGWLCADRIEDENNGHCLHLYEHLAGQLKAHIVVCDSILAAASLPVSAGDGFDLVITNPPYVSFGARNQQTLPQGSAKVLKQCFPEAAEYKVRYHSIFQDIALRYAATGGSIVLLLPDGFLTGSYYRKLRRLLLSSCRIQSLTELPAAIIPEAVVGRWCIAHYQKDSQPKSNYSVDLSTFIDDKGQAIETAATLDAARTYCLPIDELHDKSNNTLRLLFDKKDHALLKLTDQMPPFKSVLNGYTGIRSLAGRNSITGKHQLSKFWRRGITSGAQVRRFWVSWTGDWINVNPELLFKGGFDEQIIEKPKILVRQTGDSLVCAYDQNGLYHLNNVHSFSAALRDNASLNLIGIAAIMNSTLWRHIYRLKTRETGRALAQVDIDTVESMPFQPLTEELTSKIALLANHIAELLSFFSTQPCQIAEDLILFIDRSIDRLIYDAYGLDAEIVERVESVSAKYPRQRITEKTKAETQTTFTERAERLVKAAKSFQSNDLEIQKRLPSSKEVHEFIKEISW